MAIDMYPFSFMNIVMISFSKLIEFKPTSKENTKYSTSVDTQD